MYDLIRCPPETYDDVSRIAAELHGIVDADDLMLVGARCRDLLHTAHGNHAALRQTHDADIAIATSDWSTFLAIRATFPHLRSAVHDAGHRFLIADIPVDVIPFGDVELPPGTVLHPTPGEPMNVHGFRDAFDNADRLPALPGVRLATPAGYAVLKLHAWLDRLQRNEYKDGPDLGLVVEWYYGDLEDLFETHTDLVEQYQFDAELAAAAAVGADMIGVLSAKEVAVLQDRARNADRLLLARHFTPPCHSWGSNREWELVNALFESILT